MTATPASSDGPVEDEASWASQGFTREQARRAQQAGLPWWAVHEWRRNFADVTAAEALAWWECPEVVPEDPQAAHYWVLQWLVAGVRSPSERPQGLAADEVMLCAIAQVPPSPQWGFRDRAICPNLMRVAHRQGVPPGVAGSLIHALSEVVEDSQYGRCHHFMNGEGVRCRWGTKQSEAAMAFVRSLRGLDWTCVLDCLRAGMTPEAAREHVRSGADMAPVRLVGALR